MTEVRDSSQWSLQIALQANCPNVGMDLVFWENSKETSVAGTEWTKETRVREEGKDIMLGTSSWAL